MGQNGLDLGGKQQSPALLQEKEGLHPHPVPGQQQLFRPLHPKGEGENAVEPVQGRRPPLCAAVEDHLRVRMGPEFVAQAFQFTPQLRRIIQFPVVHQNVPFPGPQ